MIELNHKNFNDKNCINIAVLTCGPENMVSDV